MKILHSLKVEKTSKKENLIKFLFIVTDYQKKKKKIILKKKSKLPLSIKFVNVEIMPSIKFSLYFM